jgi:ParB-like nuclease domain
MIDPGPRPEQALLPVDRLEVDEAYQRKLDQPASQRHIRNIADNFVWNKFMVVAVRPIPGDKWEIIDGQHRVAAAKLCGHALVPCQVLNVSTQAEAADIFVAANRDRLPVPIQAVFHAQVAAGNPEAVTVMRLCQQANVKILRFKMSQRDLPPGVTCAVGSLRWCLRKFGEKIAGEAIKTVAECFGAEKGALRGPLFMASATFLANSSVDVLRSTFNSIGLAALLDVDIAGGPMAMTPLMVSRMRAVAPAPVEARSFPLQEKTIADVEKSSSPKPPPAPPNVSSKAAVKPHKVGALPAKRPQPPGADEVDRFIAAKGINYVKSPEQVAEYLRIKGINATIQIMTKSKKTDAMVYAESEIPVINGREVSIERFYEIANTMRAQDGLRPLSVPPQEEART